MSRNVVIKDAVKTYGNFNAVDHANLEIESGELFTLTYAPVLVNTIW